MSDNPLNTKTAKAYRDVELTIGERLSAFAENYGIKRGYRGHKILINGYGHPLRIEFKLVDGSTHTIPINLGRSVRRCTILKAAGPVNSVHGISRKDMKLEEGVIVWNN